MKIGEWNQEVIRMIKYYCDCCKTEQERLHTFSYRCHLDPSGKWNGREHIKTGQPISGRDESKELCITCYNKIVSKAITEFVRMEGENE